MVNSAQGIIVNSHKQYSRTASISSSAFQCSFGAFIKAAVCIVRFIRLVQTLRPGLLSNSFAAYSPSILAYWSLINKKTKQFTEILEQLLNFYDVHKQLGRLFQTRHQNNFNSYISISVVQKHSVTSLTSVKNETWQLLTGSGDLKMHNLTFRKYLKATQYTDHSESLQLHKRNNRFSNSMTYSPMISLASSPIPSQSPRTVL